MKTYHFKDKIIMHKKKKISVENDRREKVGYIQAVEMDGCEKWSSFSFTSHEYSVKMGIQKRKVKNLLAPTYVIRTVDEQFTLKDNFGKNLLYFSVTGDINGTRITIEENWDGNIDVKSNGDLPGIIILRDFALQTEIQVAKDIDERSLYFAIVVLMYFMYKRYREESDFIEELLFD